MNSNNPMLNEKVLAGARAEGQVMTINGTITRTLMLLVLLVAGAIYTWVNFRGGARDEAMTWAVGGLIGGAILSFITIFFPQASPFTSPVYAICEGLCLGAISAILETKYHGIVFNAVFLTIGTLFSMLALYRAGILRATPMFVKCIIIAMVGILVVYVIDMILPFFGKSVPFVHEGGTFGIIFSLFVVGIAALNFIIDFDFIEQGERNGAPKYMEWYGAFALLLTLVWLYLEILRLLSKLRER